MMSSSRKEKLLLEMKLKAQTRPYFIAQIIFISSSKHNSNAKYWSFQEWTFPIFFCSTFSKREKSLHSFFAFIFHFELWNNEDSNTKTHSKNTHFAYWKENRRQEFFVAVLNHFEMVLSFACSLYFCIHFYINRSTLRWNIPYSKWGTIGHRENSKIMMHILIAIPFIRNNLTHTLNTCHWCIEIFCGIVEIPGIFIFSSHNVISLK